MDHNVNIWKSSFIIFGTTQKCKNPIQATCEWQSREHGIRSRFSSCTHADGWQFVSHFVKIKKAINYRKMRGFYTVVMNFNLSEKDF